MDVGQTQHYKYQETVSQALVEVEAKVSQLQHFKEDYEALHQVLTELPLKTQCPVMVPFGPLGFMPGHLVHTNEIIVLLGDDWYVERSAFQAKGMVQRRIQEIEGNLSTLTTQCENLQARTLSSTSTNPSTMLNEEGLQMVDICEPYIEPSPPPSSPSLLHESTSLRYLNPHDLTYTLSTEDQDYLSSVFDPYEDEYETSDDDEKSKRVHQQIFTPTPPPKVLEPTRPSLPPMSKGKSLKKVTFSTPVSTTQEMIEHPLDDVHATLSIHPITSSNSKVKDVSLPPVSDKVIERDTSMEDQKLMQEEIEKQVEYQQMVELYHQQRLKLLKQMDNESDDTSLSRFNQPYLPSNPDEKLKLQHTLSKLTTSMSELQVVTTPFSGSSDACEDSPAPPKKLSKFMQHQLTKHI